LSGAEEKFNLNELTELNKNNLQVFPSENYKFHVFFKTYNLKFIFFLI